MDAVTPDAGRLDYDRIAAEYDRRYEFDPLQGVADALLGLAARLPARRALEVGCGTGRWLGELAAAVPFVCGVDASRGMLGQARSRLGPFALAAARANQLPFRNEEFDLIYCVNALHHFDDRSGFLRDAFDLLRPGGALAIVASDPRRNRIYSYDYFAGSYDTELRRYASLEQISEWAAAAGFETVKQRRVQHVSNTRTGRAVLADPFLSKNASSHLGLLSDEAYAAGLANIEQALAAAERRGEQLVFPYEQDLWMIAASR